MYGIDVPETTEYWPEEEDEQDTESASETDNFFNFPGMPGGANQQYKQSYDIVNEEGEPIGNAQEIMETYHKEDGELGQELAALEKVAGKFGENGVFQGQQQSYEKGM